MKNNFCKIYISSKAAENQIHDILKNVATLNYLFFEVVTFIDKNSDYDDLEELKFPDGFLSFKYLLNLDFVDSEKENDCINYVNEILSVLWREKIPAVASCDYEHLLLRNGGYSDEEVFCLSHK